MKNAKQIFTSKKKGIYCFADSVDLCRKLLDFGARVIQFRNKKIDDSAFYDMALEMRSIVDSYNDALLIINDRVDIAIQSDADGVHIGQEDENIRDVMRRIPKNMIIGVSVDSAQEAVEAEKSGATYVGAGAAFPTPTKPDAVVIGIEGIRRVVDAVHIPVVAIGGITLQNISQVIQTGAAYFAVISEINNSKNIPARLNEFFKAIGII